MKIGYKNIYKLRMK